MKLIDKIEFGIEEKDQQGLPPLELNFGFNENKDNIAKTDQQAQKGLGTYYYWE